MSSPLVFSLPPIENEQDLPEHSEDTQELPGGVDAVYMGDGLVSLMQDGETVLLSEEALRHLTAFMARRGYSETPHVARAA